MMSKAKENSGFSMTHTTDERTLKETLGGGPMEKRLCRIAFTCPVCRNSHMTEQYITLPAGSEEEFLERLDEQEQDVRFLSSLILAGANYIHDELGGIQEVQKEIIRLGNQQGPWVVDIQVTGESQFTCDGCRHTFPEIQEMRDHHRVCIWHPHGMLGE